MVGLQTGSRSAQAGFTLVEMIVAMLISMVALMAISKVLLDTMHGSGRSLNNRQAQTQASNALEVFARDVRQAQSPDRTMRKAGSPDQLRLMLLQNQVPSGSYPWDITVATGNSLWFVSDVVPAAAGVVPAPECVGWTVSASPPYELTRTVRSGTWKNCGPGAGTSQTMLTFAAVSGNETSRPANVFTYDFSYNHRPAQVPLDPNDCAPATSGGIPANWRERNGVKAVHVNLGAAVADEDVAQDKLLLTADIETRLSHDYTYAMGCTY